MKILLLDVNYKKSSTGKIVYDIYSKLRKNNNEVAVCYGRGKKDKDPDVFKFGINIETYLHAIITRVFGYTGGFSFFSTRRLIKFIKKYNPDLIHLHELHAYFLNIYKLLDFLQKLNISIVWTYHSEFMYTGKCGYAFECNKWLTRCGNCPQIKEYPKSLLFDHTKYMFDRKRNSVLKLNDLYIVTPSEWLKNRVIQAYQNKVKCQVIYNGIDTSIYKYVDSVDKFKGKKVVLSVGAKIFSIAKGGEQVLNLAKRFVNDDVLFILVGADFSDSYDNVLIIERTYNQQELVELYSRAKIFLICSKSDNFPTTCLEAQCCGTVICGYDTGGVVETAIDKGNFTDYGNIDALEKIVRMNLAKEYSKERLAAKAKELYDRDKMCDNYNKLFKEVLTTRNDERKMTK